MPLSELPPVMVQTEQLQVELVSAVDSFQPGGRHWLGLRLLHAPHWHTYWINPGDSGLATRTRWDLPAGVRVGALQWPAPKRLPLGDLTNFGYDGTQVLPIEVQLDPALPPGTDLRLDVEVSWLVCAEECIPGKARLALERPLRSAAASPSADAADIERARREVPEASDWPLQLSPSSTGYTLRLALEHAPTQAPELFPLQPQVLMNGRATPQQIDGYWQWDIPRSEYFVKEPDPLHIVLTGLPDSRNVELRAVRVANP